MRTSKARLHAAMLLPAAAGLIALTPASGGAVVGPPPATGAAPDSAAIVAVIDRFHDALAAGDSAAALALLTRDAVVLEAGNVETREEYRDHHLAADIEFARAVPRERGPIAVTIRGDVAWAASTSAARGEFQGRAVNSAGAELVILERTAEDWRIAAIHWSSRNLRS
jgi:ketosteroid isomerase-like protein